MPQSSSSTVRCIAAARERVAANSWASSVGTARVAISCCLSPVRRAKSRWAVIHSPKHNYGYDIANDKMVYVESLKLPDGFIKGTTGAGDAFCCGILYGAHEGETLEDSMRFATASAACSLSENNGTDGMRAREEVLTVLRKYS